MICLEAGNIPAGSEKIFFNPSRAVERRKIMKVYVIDSEEEVQWKLSGGASDSTGRRV